MPLHKGLAPGANQRDHNCKFSLMVRFFRVRKRDVNGKGREEQCNLHPSVAIDYKRGEFGWFGI